MSRATDLVGSDVMSGDPQAVSLLARRMSRLARDVDAMHGRFDVRHLGGMWTGEAFEAFAQTLQDVPRDLTKVSTSYSMAGDALSAYGAALDEVQTTARQLATHATDAESRIHSTNGDRTRARREVKLAKSACAGAADPVALHDAQRRLRLAASNLSATEIRHQQASGDLSTIHRRAADALSKFQGEVTRCCGRLRDASEAGIQNTPLSWYERNLSDTPIGIVISALATGLEVGVAFAGRLLAGDLAAWRTALEIVGYALAAAAVVVVVVGTGGTALIVVGALGVAVAGAALGVDYARYRRGASHARSSTGTRRAWLCRRSRSASQRSRSRGPSARRDIPAARR